MYFILRNLNDKSSLIIYHCPIKPTMKVLFNNRRLCINRFKTWYLVHVNLHNTRNLCIRLDNPPFLPQKCRLFQLSLMGTLHCIRLLTQKLLFRFRKIFSELLSKLLTYILSSVNTGLQNNCDTSYPDGGMNKKWILKILQTC